MKAKHKRLRFVLACLVVMALGTGLILRAFSDNLVFFYTPTQWHEKLQDKTFDRAREVRIGGLVKKGSIRTEKPGTIRFVITDLSREVPVRYTGMLPSLFREEQGVVAQGNFQGKQFVARSILAKHDENYMPPEVVEQLKKSGRWQH